METAEMPVKAVAPWFGSKRTLAPRIVAELGPHRSYWSPFCGSLAVELAKPTASMETVNDLHGDLINLARILQAEDTAVELYGRLSRTLMHEQLFQELASQWRVDKHAAASEAPDIDRAYRFFLCSWLGRNGVSGTLSYNQGFCVRYTKNGGHGATRFVSAVESIPAWHQRLRAMTILNRDGFHILERIEDADRVVIYVDPPYVVKGAKYVHDFESTDHERLARLLRRFRKTRVVLSYYEHPLIRDLYRNWTICECPTNKALVNQGLRGQKLRREGKVTVAPELLIINGPSLA